MSRYLFVVPPLLGHVSPALGVADELRRRGHEVAWVAHTAVVGDLVDGRSVKIYEAGQAFLEDCADLMARHDARRGAASLRLVWEEFLVPLAASMVGPVRAAVDELEPHVVVADQQAFAGSIVAAERGLPWAVSATSTVELFPPLVASASKIANWFQRQLGGLYDRVGQPQLAAAEGFDPRFSPYLVIVYSTPELVGTVESDLSSVAFVGPVLRRTVVPRGTGGQGFPWEWLGGYETRVLVSLGTLVERRGLRFLRTVLEAVDGQPYGVVLVGEAELLPPPPDNVLIRSFVPQVELLAGFDAVVSHGGQNTVAEALTFGLPLVCAPIRLDQPVTATQVVRTGAGRRVNFGRATVPQVREALDAVLHDPSYRAAARRIGATFRAAGGAATAAAYLERLAGQVVEAPPSTGTTTPVR